MIEFSTDPSRYKHWKLTFDGPVAAVIDTLFCATVNVCVTSVAAA